METTITPGKIDVIAVSGAIDALTAAELIAIFHKHIHDGHPDVIADFSQVEFMSSAGLRAILASVKEARSVGGDFRMANPSAGIDKVLKMAGFHNIVKIYPSVQEALASFGS